jgi:hypothetical protein
MEPCRAAGAASFYGQTGASSRRRETEDRRRRKDRSSSEMSKRQGPPKHQNSYAWKPNLGKMINETVSSLPPPSPLPLAFHWSSDLTVSNSRHLRSPGEGFGLCRRSPGSASTAGTRSTGSAGREFTSHQFRAVSTV